MALGAGYPGAGGTISGEAGKCKNEKPFLEEGSPDASQAALPWPGNGGLTSLFSPVPAPTPSSFCLGLVTCVPPRVVSPVIRSNGPQTLSVTGNRAICPELTLWILVTCFDYLTEGCSTHWSRGITTFELRMGGYVWDRQFLCP